jgi:alpha-L-fucosidase
VLPLPQKAPGAFEQDRQSWRSLWELRGRNQASDLGSRSELSKAKALCWWPAETDVSIRPGWFYHPEDDQRVKPLKTLLDYWFTAVGGNAVLLLNVPADRRGLIAAPDVAVLKDVGNYLNATFANNLARSATARHEGREVHFEQPVTVDLFDLAEDIAVTGQRVEQFYVDVMREGAWQECATGTTIGFRRLLRTEPITGTAFRVRITKQRGPASIKDFGLFLRPTLMQAPTIGRNKNGAIAITAGQLAVRYTIDGSTVTDTSPLYSKPFALPMGGTVRARATASNDSNTVVLGTATETSASFGLSPVGWKIVACSSEQGGDEPASNAIDGNPNTLWHTRYQPDTPSHPHYLTIDLGQTHTLTGFLYQPRTTGNNGTIADYEFHGSHDGVQWTELAKGTFGNIGNNPIARTVPFEKAAQNTRFVRFTALREVAGRAWASVGELSVLAGPEVKNK